MEKNFLITNQAGNRLDKTLCESDLNLSRGQIQKLIDEKKILVNNSSKKASYILKENDTIKVTIIPITHTSITPENIPLDIIYEDNDIIAVNKPKGLVVHPANGHENNTLVNAIMAICKNSLSSVSGELRPGIVHRLDKDTSGIIIVAKNDFSHINLSKQIKNRQVTKIYIALVKGIVKENEASIDMPIGRSTKDRKKMSVCKDGKSAITHFKVLQRYEQGFTLLQIVIETGRTHQIRVHLAEIGYPIIGDYTYSNGKNPFNIYGQMLHAKSLSFVHPSSNKHMTLIAPLPEYFSNILDQL